MMDALEEKLNKIHKIGQKVGYAEACVHLVKKLEAEKMTGAMKLVIDHFNDYKKQLADKQE